MVCGQWLQAEDGKWALTVTPTEWYILHCGIHRSRSFTRRLGQLAGEAADEVLRELQKVLLRDPARGDVVRGIRRVPQGAVSPIWVAETGRAAVTATCIGT